MGNEEPGDSGLWVAHSSQEVFLEEDFAAKEVPALLTFKRPKPSLRWVRREANLDIEVDYQIAGALHELPAIEEGAHEVVLHFAGFIELQHLKSAEGVAQSGLADKEHPP